MRMAPRIAELVGAGHRHYVEPFAGSAAVLMHMEPSAMESINDLDNEVHNFWTVLREHTDELIAALRLTPYGKAEYESADFQGDEVERARHFVIRSCMSFSGTQTGGFGPSSPRKGSHRASAWARLVDERLPEMAERIRRVELERVDALRFLERWDDPRTSAYVDPPYLASTRSSLGDYRTEVDGADYHRELLKRLNDFSGRLVLSGYESELYAETLGEGWTLHRIGIHAASANARNRSTRRTECLWVKEANR